MNQVKLIGVSQDNNYLFTNNGFYITKGEGGYVKYTESLPYLVEIAQDNNDYEFTKGIISLTEYSLKPRKILSILLESLPFNESLSILKEWDNKFGNKLLITESDNSESVKKIVSESFGEIKSLVSEQNTYSTAVDITNKIIDALSKTFNDDEQEALNQVKRINSADLLSNVEKVIKSKKKMSLINYLNSEMSDVDWEYKSIYNHLKNIQSSYSKGYQENKFYQSVGKGIDAAQSGLALVGKALSSVAKKIIIPIIKKGVLPFMRWIRRNLNTYLGIIVDVVLSLLPTVVVMKVVWGLIVLLDIYEIATGDYDPDDPDRAQMPFVYLVTDIISWGFTAAAGKAASVTLKSGIKGGKAVGSATKGILKKALDTAPTIKNGLKVVQEFLNKLFGAGNFATKIFGYVDSVITKMVNWIKSLLGETSSVLKTKKGVATASIGLGLGVGMAELFAERSFGEGKSGIYGRGKEVKQMQNNLLAMSETPEFNVGYKGPVTGVYDKKTGDAVYKLYQKLKMTPKREATPYIATVLGAELQPNMLFKLVPKDNLKDFGTYMKDINNKFSIMAKKLGAKVDKN